MERQKSFFLKPTRLLVFWFTISSSVIFLTVFTFWLVKSSPYSYILQETNFEYNKTTFLGTGPQPFTVQNFTEFSRILSATTVIANGYGVVPENTSGSGGISVVTSDNESEMLNAEEDGETADNNLTQVQESVAVVESPSEKIESKASEEKKSRSIAMVKDEGHSREDVVGKITTDSPVKVEALSNRMNAERKNKVFSVDNSGNLENGRIKQKLGKECDVTSGSWVYDKGYPLYTNSSCPFIDEGFDCAGNGRLDGDYTKWRWQPQDCDIPRFNVTKMLELIRGKRLVFVGDSINRNQWESMLCMLMGAIKDPKRVYETHGRRITKEKGNYSFKFVDYKCTVEYYVSHYLVHEGKARIGHRRVQTLRIDSIDHGSSRWRGADILIFNTAHWWSHFKTKAGINYYQEGNLVYPQLDVHVAFRRAMGTWASWVNKHINPRKTRVFFRSSAPSHFSGGQWNSGGHCKEAVKPLSYTSRIDSQKNTITEDIIKQMKIPVTFLDITSLSGYRVDGHPSIYGKKPSTRYSSRIQDCSHWCLPGVPDTWNELLYFHLQSKVGTI